MTLGRSKYSDDLRTFGGDATISSLPQRGETVWEDAREEKGKRASDSELKKSLEDLKERVDKAEGKKERHLKRKILFPPSIPF